MASTSGNDIPIITGGAKGGRSRSTGCGCLNARRLLEEPDDVEGRSTSSESMK